MILINSMHDIAVNVKEVSSVEKNVNGFAVVTMTNGEKFISDIPFGQLCIRLEKEL